MTPEEIGQPHDRLVKQVFSRKETAARFLQSYLPQKIVDSLDWSELELRPGSFVDAKLRHQETDLLFRVPFHRSEGAVPSQAAQELLLYCLFEHQRKVEQWMICGYSHT